MNNSISGRLLFMITFGIMALLLMAIALPTPLRDWFANGSVGGTPATIAVIALIILVTPVSILAIILSKYNVDFADESSGDL